MKRGLDWQGVSRNELADHLESADVIRSQAVGDTSIYHCRHESGETVAIALPGGTGLIVGMAFAVSPVLERRKNRKTEPLDG